MESCRRSFPFIYYHSIRLVSQHVGDQDSPPRGGASTKVASSNPKLGSSLGRSPSLPGSVDMTHTENPHLHHSMLKHPAVPCRPTLNPRKQANSRCFAFRAGRQSLDAQLSAGLGCICMIRLLNMVEFPQIYTNRARSTVPVSRSMHHAALIPFLTIWNAVLLLQTASLPSM
jgi:hypothetical protein